MAFRYPCCVTLDRYTGLQTAIMALNEVAALEFARVAKAEENPDSYIFRRCLDYNIYVGKSYFEEFRERRMRYYIVQAHEAVEVFCRDFRAEFEVYFARHLGGHKVRRNEKKTAMNPYLTKS